MANKIKRTSVRRKSRKNLKKRRSLKRRNLKRRSLKRRNVKYVSYQDLLKKARAAKKGGGIITNTIPFKKKITRSKRTLKKHSRKKKTATHIQNAQDSSVQGPNPFKKNDNDFDESSCRFCHYGEHYAKASSVPLPDSSLTEDEISKILKS